MFTKRRKWLHKRTGFLMRVGYVKRNIKMDWMKCEWGALRSVCGKTGTEKIKSEWLQNECGLKAEASGRYGEKKHTVMVSSLERTNEACIVKQILERRGRRWVQWESYRFAELMGSWKRDVRNLKNKNVRMWWKQR